MPPNAYGELLERLPIFAAAALIGLATGVLAIERATSGRGRSWGRVVAQWALTVGLAVLVGSRLDLAGITLLFWVIAAGGMAVIDLGIVCLVDPLRPRRRFSRRAARRITVALPVGAAVVLAVLARVFDFNQSAAAGMAIFVTGLAVVDAIVRLVAIRLMRSPGRGR